MNLIQPGTDVPGYRLFRPCRDCFVPVSKALRTSQQIPEQSAVASRKQPAGVKALDLPRATFSADSVAPEGLVSYQRPGKRVRNARPWRSLTSTSVPFSSLMTRTKLLRRSERISFTRFRLTRAERRARKNPLDPSASSNSPS